MRNPFTGKTVPASIDAAVRNPFPKQLTLTPDQPIYYIYAVERGVIPSDLTPVTYTLPEITVSDFHAITYSEDQNTELNFLNSLGLLHFSDMKSKTPEYHVSGMITKLYDYFTEETLDKRTAMIAFLRDIVVPARMWRLYFQRTPDVRIKRDLEDLKRLAVELRSKSAK